MLAPPPQTGLGTASPIGLRGSRGAILVELKRTGGATARELGAKLGVSLNAIRHHLRELGAESLVVYDRRRRGVGAPAFAYRLSHAGEALFPRRYEATLLQVLDQVVARDGRAAAVGFLESQFEALGRRLQSELGNASPPERLAAVARALTDEGYMAESQSTLCCGTLIEHNCAIQAVAERFPEICDAEARFIAQAVGGSVERREHMITGCAACRYTVRFAQPTDAEADAAAVGAGAMEENA